MSWGKVGGWTRARDLNDTEANSGGVDEAGAAEEEVGEVSSVRLLGLQPARANRMSGEVAAQEGAWGKREAKADTRTMPTAVKSVFTLSMRSLWKLPSTEFGMVSVDT